MTHDPCTNTECARCNPAARAHFDQQQAALNEDLDTMIGAYMDLAKTFGNEGDGHLENVAVIAHHCEQMSPNITACAQRLAYAIARIGDAYMAVQEAKAELE